MYDSRSDVEKCLIQQEQLKLHTGESVSIGTGSGYMLVSGLTKEQADKVSDMLRHG